MSIIRNNYRYWPGVDMLEAFLIALLVAKIRKYRLAPLFKEWTAYLVILFALVCMYMNFSIFQGDTFIFNYLNATKIIYGLIFAVLIIKYGLYKAGFLGAASAFIGGMLNSAVIKANGGKMPVFPSVSYLTGFMTPDSFKFMETYDDVHIQGSASTKLSFLSDYIDLGYTILSPGDVLFYSVVFIVVYSLIKHLNSGRPAKSAEEGKELQQ